VEEERAETPPREDQTFEDDDGTVYVWDRNTRRYVEGEAAAAVANAEADYGLEEMTYVAEEETVPMHRRKKVF
jgi:hypothetical protein